MTPEREKEILEAAEGVREAMAEWEIANNDERNTAEAFSQATHNKMLADHNLEAAHRKLRMLVIAPDQDQPNA